MSLQLHWFPWLGLQKPVQHWPLSEHDCPLDAQPPETQWPVPSQFPLQHSLPLLHEFPSDLQLHWFPWLGLQKPVQH
jgi:hypothetical protein